MKGDEKTSLRHYIFWAIVILLIIASYFIIKPYLIALITSFILAFLIKPVYSFLNKKLKKPFSAGICILLIVIIILAPLATITAGVVQQAYLFLNDSSLLSTLNSISNNAFFTSLNLDVQALSLEAVNLLISLLTSAISELPSLALSILIIIIGIYYILINWDYLSSKLTKFIPFPDEKTTMLDISDATKSIVYGTVLIAFIEAIVTFFGFLILGVKAPLLLAALMFLSAFIPAIGPIAIWGPTAVYYLLTKSYGIALGVVIVGIIVSIGIDYLLRTKMLGDKSKIHPLIMLVGILGGVSLFGIFGFIIGPLVLVYTIKIIEDSMNH